MAINQDKNIKKKTLEYCTNSNFNKNFLPYYDDTSFIDYYHIIIGIDSFKNLLSGWDIKYSDSGYEQYLKQKDKKSCVVGVVGISNKGKSFILQKISGTHLPNGHSIKTEGLSLKYPLVENKNVILLDSAGLENPLLDNQYSHFLVPNMDQSKALQKIRTIARDKQLTEMFIQQFVLNNSDILVLVIGIMTYSDQKLLNRIKMGLNNKGTKLFVIHNLWNFVTIEQVHTYITEVLKESLTFKLEEQIIQNLFIKENEGKKHLNKVIYVEKSNDTRQNIIHLIMAAENSEAGDYFNISAINFIKYQCMCYTNIKPFPVIDKIKDHLVQMSKMLMESPIISKDELSSEEKSIKLLNRGTVELKKCLVDELGFSNFYGNIITPKYSHYIFEEFFVIEIELVGKIINMKTNVISRNENNVFLITGEKRPETAPPESNSNIKYKSNRNFGLFFLEIVVPIEKVPLREKKFSKMERINGIIKLYYSLKNEVSEEQAIII